MTRISRLMGSLALVSSTFTVVLVAAQPAGATGGAPAWGTAQEVTGVSSVVDGTPTIGSPFVACTSVGNCSDAGTYPNNQGGTDTYVNSETSGTWGTAQTGVSGGLGNQSSAPTAIACGAPGECVVGGYYTDSSGEQQAFVIDEVAGVWQTMVAVPGVATLNAFGQAQVSNVACSAAGSCVIAGQYADGSGNLQTFVDTEVAGTWGTAIELPGSSGLHPLSTTPIAEVTSQGLSCSSVGNCAVVGFALNTKSQSNGFVASLVNGTWRNAAFVPGLAALNKLASAQVTTVSCPSDGACTLGGSYTDATKASQAFVAQETAGSWGHAVESPGVGKLNAGAPKIANGGASVQSVSCAAAGDCSAVGWYENAKGASELFVDNESSGVWATAAAMPHLATLNAGASENNTGATASDLVCTAVGQCEAAGSFLNVAGNEGLFVIGENAGVWSNATALATTSTLTSDLISSLDGAQVDTLSCPSAGNCVVAGDVPVGFSSDAGFAAVQSSGTWPVADLFTTSESLVVGANSWVASVACPAAGSCEAVGNYRDGTGVWNVFTATEASGVWGADVEVPGLAALTTSGAQVGSLSCSGVGSCALGGIYLDSSGRQRPFVDTEASGVWQDVAPVGGINSLDTPPSGASGYSAVNGLSCTGTGDCSAIGYYTTSKYVIKPFVLTESAGVWGNAQALSSLNALTSGSALFESMSCSSVGNCAAGGFFRNPKGVDEPLVITQTNGSWSKVSQLAGASTLNAGGSKTNNGAEVSAVSCAATGCEVAGDYVSAQLDEHILVAGETGGVWKNATAINGMPATTETTKAAANDTSSLGVSSLACPSWGDCVAVGTAPNAKGVGQSYVVSQKNGVWSKAVVVADLKIPSGDVPQGTGSELDDVACSSVGNCSAVGDETYGSNSFGGFYGTAVFVLNDVNGTWGSVEVVPGTASLNAGDSAYPNAVACDPSGGCTMGGEYTDGSGQPLPFVDATT